MTSETRQLALVIIQQAEFVYTLWQSKNTNLAYCILNRANSIVKLKQQDYVNALSTIFDLIDAKPLETTGPLFFQYINKIIQ